jgi:hexosaminidase
MSLTRVFVALIVFAPVQAAGAQNVPSRLMPLPAHMSLGTGSLAIGPGFSAEVTAGETPRLHDALGRTMKQLEQLTGLAFEPRKPGATTSVVVSVGAHASAEDVDADESYDLTVTASGVRIRAATDLGALHSLETLVQLVESNSGSFDLPSITIRDASRFHWRGLLIDCSRHFEPIDVLKRNIDAMASVKLNVFHWHLTEDQGFRIESKRFPKLTASGSDGQFYTQEQARDLVAYAHARGIRVVPEFEMPGHSSAWLVAYPELNSGTQPAGIRREFGVSPYVVDPTRDESYKFIADFLAEMATIFPDPYVHIGGDEAPAPDWKTNPRILAFMRDHGLRDNAALQAYFNQRVLKILTNLHKHMVGWDEILNPALPKDVVIQSWRGVKSLDEGAQQGYQGILSAPYYLDHMETAEKLYLADPVPAGTILTPSQSALVLGGEVCMWSEFVDSRLLDSRLWPRAAAIAERFWSPASTRDVADMYRRLDKVSIQLETLGLTHLKHEDAALRDLSGDQDIRDLRTLAEAFEPAPFSERSRAQHATTQTPLTGFVDALMPDPPVERRLSQAALLVAARPAADDPQSQHARAVLQGFFEAETQVAERIRPQLQNNPRLTLLEPRVAQLLALTAIGTQALRYTHGEKAPAGWKQTVHTEIANARKPAAFVRFDFLDALTSLVDSTP